MSKKFTLCIVSILFSSFSLSALQRALKRQKKNEIQTKIIQGLQNGPVTSGMLLQKMQLRQSDYVKIIYRLQKLESRGVIQCTKSQRGRFSYEWSLTNQENAQQNDKQCAQAIILQSTDDHITQEVNDVHNIIENNNTQQSVVPEPTWWPHDASQLEEQNDTSPILSFSPVQPDEYDYFSNTTSNAGIDEVPLAIKNFEGLFT